MKRDEETPATCAPIAVAANFDATLRLWGALPTSRMETRDSCLFVSTGTAIPDQNYATCSGEEDAEANVRRSSEFFRDEGVPFSWWFPPGTRNERLRRALERCGIPERCAPPAMARALDAPLERPPSPSACSLRRASTPSEAGDWARYSLEGFDSGSEHEERFAAFSAALVSLPFADSFRLLTLRVADAPAATTLVSITEGVAGIYYFSTIPAFRRRGLGLLLLYETLEEARRSGCYIAVLQASPMGFPLYATAGFVERGRFTVHSADPDAC